MMEDFDIPLRRAPVAETPIASGGGIYAKIYRHSRSDFEAPSIDNHEVVLVLQGCGMARRTLSDGLKQSFRFRSGLIAKRPPEKLSSSLFLKKAWRYTFTLHQVGSLRSWSQIRSFSCLRR